MTAREIFKALAVTIALTLTITAALMFSDRIECGNIGGTWRMDWSRVASHCEVRP